MNDQSKPILPDDPAAATQIDVKAWQSRTGHIFLEEKLARYDGSTHFLCKRNHIVKNQHLCEICEPLDQHEAYSKYETKAWSGEPIYSILNDKWFFTKSEVTEFLKETGKTAQELMLVFAEPQYAYQIDPDEYFEEYLPDGINVPDKIQAAFNVLNEAIKTCGDPLCYFPTEIAVLMENNDA